jgi:hypothetical protein
MSDLQDIIARSAQNAFESGSRYGKSSETIRVLKILEPLTKCDPEVCADGCSRDKCASQVIAHLIMMIGEEE